MNFDIEKIGKLFDNKMATGDLKDIGTLILKEKAIKFVYDFDYIYANGRRIISNCNDQWSSINAFNQTMIAAYGDNYTTLMPV
jgi:hypothetical protein